MINSIKYFEENCIGIFEKLETNFMKDPTSLPDQVLALTSELHNLGLRIIQEWLENTDNLICNSVVRKKRYYIEHHDKRSLISSLGTVSYTRTLFVDKETRKDGVYLLDRLMGLEKHERLTDDAVANLLEEAVQSSYRRGGEAASLEDNVTKQTVMEKLHQLRFPQNSEKPEEKKCVDYLYIEADEDHLSLQFQNRKGDLVTNAQGRKINGLISKLVYVHEGLKPENIIQIGTPEERPSRRWKLINPHYFCSTAGSQTNEEFWKEIFAWIETHYDLFKVKKIYLNADGGGWIQACPEWAWKLTYVLDEYHLRKAVASLTSHMKDSIDDAKKEIFTAIRSNDREEFTEITERLKRALQEGTEEAGEKRINENRDYILNNWIPARIRLNHEEGVVGSSTEGHVYHILSKRMSTNPMGWSRLGAEKMSKLRAYYCNGGDMMALVKYQRKEIPKAAGAENDILRLEEILRSEKNRHEKNGKYVEAMKCTISEDSKKYLKGLLGQKIL